MAAPVGMALDLQDVWTLDPLTETEGPEPLARRGTVGGIRFSHAIKLLARPHDGGPSISAGLPSQAVSAERNASGSTLASHP